jgi:hypothetical protein
MTMTIEEQFAQVAEKTSTIHSEVVKETAAYLKLIHRHFGKGRDIYHIKEHEDDCWESPQKAVWEYLLEVDEPKFLKLKELLEAVNDSSEIWGIFYHATYMASFCLLAEDDEEVDELLEKYNTCELCRDTAVLWLAQWMVSERPMNIQAVSVLVHTENSSSLYGLLSEWVGYEADSWEFEEVKYPNGFTPAVAG